MNLLQEIQESVIQEGNGTGSIMLKLRLLAARLGSQNLENWVKFESEGYPMDAPLPNYRMVPVTYKGTFLGIANGIKNAPIPTYLVEKYAGEGWVKYKFRQSIAVIDELLEKPTDGGGSIEIDASNLTLLLEGKVYEGMACNEVRGTISRTSLAEIQYSVRSRILEFTIELEKSVPAATKQNFGIQNPNDQETSAAVTTIFNQTIYGNLNAIHNSGNDAKISLTFGKGDNEAFKDYLTKAGIAPADAIELAGIVASEDPGDKKEPLGARAKEWFVKNLQKATDGTWKIGVSVATDVIKRAVLQYYGLD